MSKVKAVINAVTAPFKSPKVPALPEPVVPAAPAPTRREDTGASVVVGSDAVRNQRVSGGSAARRRSGTRDPLGGLGAGSGLNI